LWLQVESYTDRLSNTLLELWVSWQEIATSWRTVKRLAISWSKNKIWKYCLSSVPRLLKVLSVQCSPVAESTVCPVFPGCWKYCLSSVPRLLKVLSVQCSPVAESTVCPVFPGFWKGIALFEYSYDSSAIPSHKSSVKMKVGMQYLWNDTDRWETEVLREKHVAVLLKAQKTRKFWPYSWLSIWDTGY
jgi:hypothetical protein